MTMPIHDMLADRDLLPAEHLMDAGYPSTANLLACRTEHQVRLIAPMRGDSSRHARTNSPYARSAFTIDFDQQRATCPRGHHSATWNPTRQDGQDVIVVSFPLSACIVCPARTECTRSNQRRRRLTLRPRYLHEALRDARAEQQTDAWKQTYRARAGIEGTIHQATAATGIHQARYTGLGKVGLEHAFAATAPGSKAPSTRPPQPPASTKPDTSDSAKSTLNMPSPPPPLTSSASMPGGPAHPYNAPERPT